MNKITTNYIGAGLMGIGGSLLFGLKGIPFIAGIYMVINSSFALEKDQEQKTKDL